MDDFFPFAYLMFFSVKSSGLIALSQWTAAPSVDCGTTSLAESWVNILEKSKNKTKEFCLTDNQCNFGDAIHPKKIPECKKI